MTKGGLFERVMRRRQSLQENQSVRVCNMTAARGNKYATEGKRWAAAIKRALARKAEDAYDGGLDLVADRVVAAAIEGQQWAVAEIANRIDGKATEHIVSESTHTTHITVGNARTLANTLRFVEQASEPFEDAVYKDIESMGSA